MIPKTLKQHTLFKKDHPFRSQLSSESASVVSLGWRTYPNSLMRIFFAGRGRTRVFGEAYMKYSAAGNPRRTKLNGEKTIYGFR